MDVGNLISGSSPFLNSSWTSGSSRFMYYWSLAWRILSITLLACESESESQLFETPMNYAVHGILHTRILGWVTFPFSRGSSQPRGHPGLPHCWRILYQLSHKGSPRILEWVAYPFSSRSSWPRKRIRVPCIAGWFFTNWAIREMTAIVQSHFFGIAFLWDWNENWPFLGRREVSKTYKEQKTMK